MKTETEPAFRDDPLFMSRRISASYREVERRIREMESRQKSRQVIQGNQEDDPVSDVLAEFWDRKAEEIKNG